MAYLNGQKILLKTNVTTVNLPIDQTYNPESENAQSGKAVAQALESSGSGGAWEKLVDLKTTEEVNSVVLSQTENSKIPKCKEFLVRIVYPISSTGENLALGAAYCYLNDYEHAAFRFANTSTTTSATTEQRCHISIIEKLVYTIGTKNASGQSSVTTETHMLVGDRFISSDVTKIICRLNTNENNYPIGTQFIVYGKVES